MENKVNEFEKAVKKAIKIIVVGYFSIVVCGCDADIDQICGVKFDGFDITELRDIDNVVKKDTLTLFFYMNFTIVRQKYKDRGCYKIDAINPITSITIKTMYDYSDDYLAGSDITALFRSKIYSYDDNDYVFISVKKFVDEHIREWHNQFYLYMMDDTCAGEKQKFEITIVLSDDTVLKQQTNELLLE
jgi:hypothetical protein